MKGRKQGRNVSQRLICSFFCQFLATQKYIMTIDCLGEGLVAESGLAGGVKRVGGGRRRNIQLCCALMGLRRAVSATLAISPTRSRKRGCCGRHFVLIKPQCSF